MLLTWAETGVYCPFCVVLVWSAWTTGLNTEDSGGGLCVQRLQAEFWPRCYRKNFMLNSTEHEIFPAH